MCSGRKYICLAVKSLAFISAGELGGSEFGVKNQYNAGILKGFSSNMFFS